MIAFSTLQTADMKTDWKEMNIFFPRKYSKRCFFGYAHTLVEVLISEGEIPQGGKQHLLLLLHHFFLNESFFFLFTEKG
jgi:hypothetical protein